MDYFNYTRNLDSDSPIMLIDRQIGGIDENGCMGIDGDMFARELYALDEMGKKSINVWINSVGGLVMDGMSIYNAILNTKTKVNTINTGICASIAAVIFQAGRTRTMSDYSLLMFHNTAGAENGDVATKFNNSIATMISSRSGNSVDDVLAIMDKTTWMTASEALLGGYCDEVTNSASANKKKVSLNNKVEDNWKICAKITNSALSVELNNSNNTKTTNMSNLVTVANSLGLNPEASGEAIAKEIQNLKNIADLAKSNISAKDAEIEKLTNSVAILKKEAIETTSAKDAEIAVLVTNKDAEIEKVKNEFKVKEEKLDRLEKEKTEELAAAVFTNCKNMVEGYAKSGRIENKVEVVDKWVELAIKNGLEDTEDLLKNIPMNKKAAFIPVTQTNFLEAKTTAAALALKNRQSRKN